MAEPEARSRDVADWPRGFQYRADFLTETEERDLLARLGGLEFSEVRMHGVVAHRRVIHYGWLYGYESWRLAPGPPIPPFLLPLRSRAAELAAVDAEGLEEALVTQYSPGAGIGWHRDAPGFGVVIGISLASPCRFRLRRGSAAGGERYSLTLLPRSAYVLSGEVRSGWQHSIPPSTGLRYSITFRTLRRRKSMLAG